MVEKTGYGCSGLKRLGDGSRVLVLFLVVGLEDQLWFD